MKFYSSGLLRYVREKDSILYGDAAYRYKSDLNKEPGWLTIDIYSLGGDKAYSLEEIVDIKSDNHFIARISNKSRPRKFDSEEGEPLDFKKVSCE